MNKQKIQEIGDEANKCPNNSYYALILLRELCKALLAEEEKEERWISECSICGKWGNHLH